MASREASRLNFARLPDALFFGALAPRAASYAVCAALEEFRAAAGLSQQQFVRKLRVRCALPIYLPQLLLTGRIFCRAHRLSRTRHLKEQAAFYLWEKFEEFWEAAFT